jgi:hypothetical protein
MERGDPELVEPAARLLVMSDHGFRPANVTGQDHNLASFLPSGMESMPRVLTTTPAGKRVSGVVADPFG